MKTIPVLVSVIAASVFPFSLGATTPTEKNTASLSVQKIDEASADAAVTAKDFIGRAVHDVNGEKLGSISDITIARILPAELADGLRRDNAAEAPRTERPAIAGLPTSEPAAIISVGGILGLGDNLVTVPLSALRRDAGNDRFSLNVSKDQFVALAKQKVDTYSSSTDRPRAEIDAKVEADRVAAAIKDDSVVGRNAGRINVVAEGDDVVLKGTAENEAQKSRIVAIARSSTEKPIVDRIVIAMK